MDYVQPVPLFSCKSTLPLLLSPLRSLLSIGICVFLSFYYNSSLLSHFCSSQLHLFRFYIFMFLLYVPEYYDLSTYLSLTILSYYSSPVRHWFWIIAVYCMQYFWSFLRFPLYLSLYSQLFTNVSRPFMLRSLLFLCQSSFHFAVYSSLILLVFIYSSLSTHTLLSSTPALNGIF